MWNSYSSILFGHLSDYSLATTVRPPDDTLCSGHIVDIIYCTRVISCQGLERKCGRLANSHVTFPYTRQTIKNVLAIQTITTVI